MLQMDKSSKIMIGLLVAILLIVVGNNIYFRKQMKYNLQQYGIIQRGSDEFDLINPLVVDKQLADIGEEIRDEIGERFADMKGSGKMVEAGMYFRDLGSGYGFGVDEHEVFIPASLLKMPTMMAWYKLAETDPSILEKKITYMEGSVDYNQFETIKPEREIQIGQTYTVNELIEMSIVYSDNNANYLLVTNIGQDEYLRTFREIGIAFPDTPDQEVMTPKAYTSVYRILYNSSYINKDYSQRALDLLLKSAFKDGLAAGLNGNIKLASKFGERVIPQPGGKSLSYFHDCGIIYTKHPYVLCVMSKGEDMEELKKIVQEVSKIVYSEMKY
jgi:beta-lactamase class A